MIATHVMGLHKPPHSGRSIRMNCPEATGLMVMDGAKILGITRHMLLRMARRVISTEMALSLEKAFGGAAQSWLA